MAEIGYQIVQAIAGRMRIRAAWLETDQTAAGQLQRLMESLSYVTSVRINPLAQSIVIIYEAQAISRSEAEAQLITAIEAVHPAPSVPVNPSEHPAVTVSSPVVVNQPERGGPGSATATIADIPSPWDEPAPTVAVHSPTSQAITPRNAKANFVASTPGQDPENIASHYEAGSQSIGPTDSALEAAVAPTADRAAKSGEVASERFGEEVGAVMGEMVGEVLLGPVGAIAGEIVGTIAGEIIGIKITEVTIAAVEEIAPPSAKADKKSVADPVGQTPPADAEPAIEATRRDRSG